MKNFADGKRWHWVLWCWAKKLCCLENYSTVEGGDPINQLKVVYVQRKKHNWKLSPFLKMVKSRNTTLKNNSKHNCVWSRCMYGSPCTPNGCLSSCVSKFCLYHCPPFLFFFGFLKKGGEKVVGAKKELAWPLGLHYCKLCFSVVVLVFINWLWNGVSVVKKAFLSS